MSETSRERWNAKHSSSPGHEPEAFVIECLPSVRALPPGVPRTALDVACGTGRHALLLAREGFAVTAVDVSDVALARLDEAAARSGLVGLRSWRLDLDAGSLPQGEFGIVLCTHFLDRGLWPALRRAVAPGGLLIFQTFTEAHAERTTFPPQYCLRKGELLRALEGFEILAHRVDDDGGRVLESALARRTAGSR